MSRNYKLLTPLLAPQLTLRNRVVMAPMNRRRASNGVLADYAPLYYAQRAGAGLILTDNTAIEPNAIGFLNTPGIYNDAQKAVWKRVADEVHARGGKIFMQILHAGRVGHPLNHEGGAPLIAPSILPLSGTLLTPDGQYQPFPDPISLDAQGIQNVIKAFVTAAISAMEIGFDGVEIHGAHGFLLDQFINPHSNHRTDEYGGSIENRSRLLLEVVDAVGAAIGVEHTGIRLSPYATYNDMNAYPEETVTHQFIVDALQARGLLYLHLSSLFSNGVGSLPVDYIRDARMRFHGLLIVAGGYTADSGEAILQEGLADLIAFGASFIANPDLVERFYRDMPLAIADKETFYHGGAKGYIDYPALVQKPEAKCGEYA